MWTAPKLDVWVTSTRMRVPAEGPPSSAVTWPLRAMRCPLSVTGIVSVVDWLSSFPLAVETKPFAEAVT